jgi:two-component system sensor histidine kinase DegS
MTSEAGSRSLRARLATVGAARERAKPTESANGRPDAARPSAAPRPALFKTSETARMDEPDATNGTDGNDGTTPETELSSTNGANGTPPDTDPSPTTLIQNDPFAALLDEAQAAVSGGANTLRDVRERYRAAYQEKLGRWEALRAQTAAGDGGQVHGANEAMAGSAVGVERSVLERIDLAAKSLENAWLFLAREDTSLVSDPSGPLSAADAQMRIVEAQEAERSRLAREIHDGPAQALSNAIFQVEIVQRLLDRDEALARAELKQLREVLTRELSGVRAYLSQLRLPLLAELGLSGAIGETAEQIGKVLGIQITVEVDENVDQLPETVEIVVLRVIQEALQNARKHAQPTSIRVRMVRDDGSWALEVRDNGRGFESEGPPVDGRRNFGLQFMRERAELIGARFEVRSIPNLGTAVRMTIPPGAMGMPIPVEEN